MLQRSSPRARAASAVVSTTMLLAGCGVAAEPTATVAETPPIPVVVRTLALGRNVETEVTYPAVVAADREVTVVAKAAGTVTEVAFELGAPVEADALLATIDEGKDNAYRIQSKSAVQAKLNALRALDDAERTADNQVRQAELAASQARAAKELAATSLRNAQALASTTVRQAELAAEQARTGRENLDAAADESLEGVRLSVERAENGLDLAEDARDQKLAAARQAEADLQQTARATLTATAAGAVTLIDSVNLQTGLVSGSGITLPYGDDLGNQNPQTTVDAASKMTAAWSAATTFRSRSLSGTVEDVQAGLGLLGQVQGALDATKMMLEATQPTEDLPLSSASPSGTSLSGLRAAVGGAQAQAAASTAQLTGVLQGLQNLRATNSVIEESLDQAVEDAELQLDIARSGERSARLGSSSQLDAAASGVALSENGVESARAGSTAQLDAARMQVRLAELQVQAADAAVALTKSARDSQRTGIQSQVDMAQAQLDLATYQLSTLTVRAPVRGAVTRRFVSVGDTVAPGSPIATLSETGALKVTFGVDQGDLSAVKVTDVVRVRDQLGRETSAIVARIAPAADPQTRKFVAEATLSKSGAALAPGLVVEVTLQVTRVPSRTEGTIFLPLEAVTISQNGATVLIVRDGRATKLPVTVVRVQGGDVEVAIDAPPTTQVILTGSPLLGEGVAVTISAPSAAPTAASPGRAPALAPSDPRP